MRCQTFEPSINLFPYNYRYLKGKKLTNFQQDCHNFFIEVVSTLCFGNHGTPEPALISNLMEMVMSEDSSPITEIKGSKVSEVKSSLLQLLMEHK